MKGKALIALLLVLAILVALAVWVGMRAEAFAVLLGIVAGSIAGGTTSALFLIAVALKRVRL